MHTANKGGKQVRYFAELCSHQLHSQSISITNQLSLDISVPPAKRACVEFCNIKAIFNANKGLLAEDACLLLVALFRSTRTQEAKMSLINTYRATEEAIRELQEKLKALSADDKLKKELEFEGKLRALMAEYNKSLRDIIALIDPDTRAGKAPRASKATAGKRTRKTKQYKNPNTGEVIETKGGNHKTLKEWKAKWGAAVVEGWAKLLG